jgi:amino acid transporter
MTATALPLVVIGAGLELRGFTVSQLFDQVGGFAVLAFLLVYGMVAVAALVRSLPGITRLRRQLVGSASLVAVVAVGLGYLWSEVGHQNMMLLVFGLLMLLGLLLVFKSRPGAHA